jgi:hypothetical protein
MLACLYMHMGHDTFVQIKAISHTHTPTMDGRQVHKIFSPFYFLILISLLIFLCLGVMVGETLDGDAQSTF